MKYNDYKKCRDLAWEVIIKYGVRELPVRVTELCRLMGIRVVLYEPTDGNDGYTMMVNGVPVIFVSRCCSVQRQRFTAAHELGHILLGHVGLYGLVNREPESGDNPVEQMANVIASRLLAPACVLHGCGARSAEDVMKLCNISRQSSEYRIARMDLLNERGKFGTSPLERKVQRQFAAYIRKNKF